MLNSGQLETINNLNSWLESNHPFFLLEGTGGVGKSYTIQHWLDSAKVSAIVTAPTTESLDNIAADLYNYPAKTIHKLLGFRPAPTETIDQILIKAGAPDDVKVIKEKIIILDEAFYAPKEIIHEIFTRYGHLKWLFLGDRGQFTPVGEAESALLGYEGGIYFKSELTENMRSIDPIQTKLMDDVDKLGWGVDLSEFIKTKGKCWSLLSNLIDSGDKDFVFLAFHHKVVNAASKLIRELMYDIDPDSPPFAGELVRMTEVIDEDKLVLVRQNERVTLLNYSIEGFLCQRSTGEEVYIDLDYQGKIQEQKEIALKSRDRKDWAKYHTMTRQYGNILPAYASTCNSFQGKTTGQAIIDLTDLRKSPDPKILNVAIGRSRKIPWMYK